MPTTPTARRVALDGITLNVVEGGEGPAVLLLHGWPDRATLWQHQIDTLAARGFRVIAPDLRGFGDSDRPAEVERYGLRTVLGDLLGLLDALEVGEVRVAGHDWGALVAWALAAFAPERVTRLAAFSVGHPQAFASAGFVQKQLSWYMLWFQFPGVAEAQLPADDWRWFREWAHDGVPRGADALVDAQIADLDRPGALAAGLNWYRANMPPRDLRGHRRAAGDAGDRVPGARGVERPGPRPHRAADDRLTALRRGSLALRAPAPRRALDPRPRPGAHDRAPARALRLER